MEQTDKQQLMEAPVALNEQLCLNSVRLKQPEGSIIVHLSMKKTGGCYPVRVGALAEPPGSVVAGELYTSFEKEVDKLAYPFSSRVCLAEAPDVCRDYYLYLLRGHFNGLAGVYTRINGVDELEVWVKGRPVPGESDALVGDSDVLVDGSDGLPDGSDAVPGGSDAVPGGAGAVPDGADAVPDGIDLLPGGSGAVPGGFGAVTGGAGVLAEGFEGCEKYVLSISTDQLSGVFRLHISYGGLAYVSRVCYLEHSHGHLAGLLRYEGFIIDQKDLERNPQIDVSRVYPVLNASLGEAMGVVKPLDDEKNPPGLAIRRIGGFKDTFLVAAELEKAFPYIRKTRSGVQFEKGTAAALVRLPNEHQHVEFGRGHVHRSNADYAAPFSEHGPWRRVGRTHVKVLLICPAQNADGLRDRLGELLIPRMSRLQRVPFRFIAETVTFGCHTEARPELEARIRALCSRGERPDLVLFITPFHRTEPDPAKRGFYDQIKALLRKLQLPSQFLHIHSLMDEAFPDSIPNLAVKICPKLGGVPWKSALANEPKPGLIVGINLSRDSGTHNTCLAALSIFTEPRPRTRSLTLRESSPELLGSLIHKIVSEHRQQHPDTGPVVIHFHTQLSNPERRQMLEAIQQLELGIRIYIVLIDSGHSRRLFFWDAGSPDGLPKTGTALRQHDGSFLLSINQRFSRTDAVKSYPYPLRVRMWAAGGADQEKELSEAEETALLAQLMRMAAVCWGSVIPAALPASVAYPERLAQIYRDNPNGFGLSGGNGLFEGS